MTRKGKIISLVVMSFLPQLCCYGCNPASKAETPINSEPHVTVNVEIDTLIPDEGGYIFTWDDNDFSLGLATIELDIMNQLQDEIITSEPYNVQALKNGAWTDIPLGLAFDLPGLKIAPGSTRVFQCDLHPENYDYIPGEYRILKEISVYKKQYTISIRFKLCE
ncbi:MAG TPA: immunoglobulin-like domain-containing protein [Anaerovoracaceae bacterium]|nr:immunoglobulin-like domain-containing protein [Anaerovoracaceae bacterium]